MSPSHGLLAEMQTSQHLSPGALPEHMKAHQRERQAVLILKEGGVYMLSNRMDRTGPLERAIMAFFVLAAPSAVVVYLAAPSVYTDLLMLHPVPTERYPAPVTLEHRSRIHVEKASPQNQVRKMNAVQCRSWLSELAANG
jgi:hypothetical protein